MLSLYIHFPFCVSKCNYCDFCSFPSSKEIINKYCDALIKEMDLLALKHKQEIVNTIYIGGGTPSIVPAKKIDEVLKKINESFNVDKDAEITSEANPASITDEWLQVAVDNGVNRLSIGMQAKQEKLLSILGRAHTFTQAKNTVEQAKRFGIQNINIDIMYGLPDQTLNDYLETINACIELNVKHISAYSLIIEEKTPFFNSYKAGKLVIPSEDETLEMMKMGKELLEKEGFIRYEISNYSKTGYQCRHNFGCWTQQPYLGIGLNSASMLLQNTEEQKDCFYIRTKHTDVLETYFNSIQNNILPITTEYISKNEAMFEAIMLGLRTIEGVNKARFRNMFYVDINIVYEKQIKKLVCENLLLDNVDFITLTARGLDLQNTVLMEFIN